MMMTGEFNNPEDAIAGYLRLVDRDNNPFGRLALERYPEDLRVTMIPGNLRGPDAMAAVGFCSVWNEDATDAYDPGEPDWISVPNPRYKG